MADIKKFAAGIIAGAAIAAAPVMAFAAPASAATDAPNPAAAAASHSRAFSGQEQPGGSSSFAKASHCGGGMHCNECGCS